MNRQYMIKEIKCEWPYDGSHYEAFVRRGRIFKGWRNIGHARSKDGAERICRDYDTPTTGPWFYTSDSLRVGP